MKYLYLLVFYTISLNAQLPAGAVGDWPFDGNAQDMSGNGNHGTVNGAIPAHDRFGQPGMAYKFDGVSSGIVVPNNNSVDVNGVSFSFAFWQKAYHGNSSSIAIGKHEAGSWNGYMFGVNNQVDPGYCTSTDHITWYVASGAFQDACSNAPVVNDSTWHFITGVYDVMTNQSYLYVDGVQQNDVGASSGVTSNMANLSFGFLDYTNSLFFHGVLDGARLYKRALTQSEITALFNECEAIGAPVNTVPGGGKVICMNNSTFLTATSYGTVKWYASPTSTAVLGTGTVFTTPVLSAGVHTYYAGASNTCTQSVLRTAVTVTVNECTGIGDYFNADNSVSVYPNPGNGVFTLKLGSAGIPMEAIITNQLGQTIYKTRIEKQETVIHTDLPAGVYFLKVLYSGKVVNINKLVIKD